MLTFEWEVDSNKYSEGLDYSHFSVQFPLIEDYTQIFYMFDKGDIPSIQCKMSLRGPRSVRKVYELSAISIDFYIPALTQRFSSTETSLQLRSVAYIKISSKGPR
jgi:hypothetical protein